MQHERGQQMTNVRPRYLLVGVDTEGCHHVYRTVDETIIVIDGRERIWQQDVAGVSVTDWVEYIDERRGWEERKFFKSLYDALMPKLTP